MAATGSASSFIEGTAVSIGAGMLLGALFAGLLSLILGLGPAERERAAVMWSSSVGLITVAVLVVEAIIG
jgi:hypothetical protein